jgi:hypothetical protein
LGKVQGGEEEVGCLDPRKPATSLVAGFHVSSQWLLRVGINRRGGAKQQFAFLIFILLLP